MEVTDMVEFKCPECGVQLEASENMVGETAACPECGKPIKIPSPS